MRTTDGDVRSAHGAGVRRYSDRAERLEPHGPEGGGGEAGESGTQYSLTDTAVETLAACWLTMSYDAAAETFRGDWWSTTTIGHGYTGSRRDPSVERSWYWDRRLAWTPVSTDLRAGVLRLHGPAQWTWPPSLRWSVHRLRRLVEHRCGRRSKQVCSRWASSSRA